MAYKTDKILLLISRFQTQLWYTIKQHIFIDGPFYTSQKSDYQILSIIIHNIKGDNFYSVTNEILVDKEMNAYI